MCKTLLLVLALLTGLHGCSRTADPRNRELDENAVYSAVITDMFGREGVELIVVEDQTTAVVLGDMWPDPAQHFTGRAPLGEPLEKPETETIRDFVSRNKQPTQLKAKLDLRLKYVLLPTRAKEAFFRDGGGGWDSFYAKFPGAQGIMVFSRVGFSSDKKQALVYVGNQAHMLGGAGYYVLLRKENGRWVIKDAETIWIS